MGRAGDGELLTGGIVAFLSFFSGEQGAGGIVVAVLLVIFSLGKTIRYGFVLPLT